MNKKSLYILIAILIPITALISLVNYYTSDTVMSRPYTPPIPGKPILPSYADPVTPQPVVNTTLENKLCKTIPFTAPLKQEITFQQGELQDPFVVYLRRALNDYLTGHYYADCDDNESCYPGLYQGTHYADTEYADPIFTSFDSYFTSKFIVVNTDVAPGGGESIVLMFKDTPDKVFYAWVYSDGSDYYDLRGFSQLIPEATDPTVSQEQHTLINQICSESMGI